MYQIELFKTPSGKEVVAEFILSLGPNEQAKVIYLQRLLREYGPHLRAPYSKKLSGYKNLFELRSSGKTSVRLIYSYVNTRYIILNSFTKKSNKTPSRELETALARYKTLT